MFLKIYKLNEKKKSYKQINNFAKNILMRNRFQVLSPSILNNNYKKKNT